MIGPKNKLNLTCLVPIISILSMFLPLGLSAFEHDMNPEKPELLYLDLYINKEKQSDIFLVVPIQNDVWISQRQWLNLGLKSNHLIEQKLFDETFVLVPQELNPSLDLPNLSLELSVDAQYLPVSIINKSAPLIVRPASQLGFYWNYLASFSHEPISKKANLLTHHKSVVTSMWGALGNSFLTTLGQINRAVRLNSYYQLDVPQKNIFLTVGDFFSDAPGWSLSTPMLGVQVEKNYHLVPEFISYPTVDFMGSLLTRGEVEIRMHNASYYKNNLSMGRFVLENLALPVGSQSGDLIIKDSYGIQHVLPFSYYIDASMLRPGLNAYSYGLGFQRKNYGSSSFEYGKPILNMRYKWGATNYWTPELYLEGSGKSLILGNEHRFRLYNFGSLGAIAAANIRGSTMHPLIGLDFLLSKFDINFRTSALVTFPYFQPAGMTGRPSSQYRYNINSHFRLDKDYIRNTSLSHIFVYNQYYRYDKYYLLQNIPLSSRAQLNLSGSYDAANHNVGVFALLSIFLDNHSLNLSSEADPRGIKTAGQYNYNTVNADGDRYRLSAGFLDDTLPHGSLSAGMDGRYFLASVNLTAHPKSLSYNGHLSGSFGCVDKDCFIAKPIENGFALVQIPDQKNITITREFGGVLGRTDRWGNLVLTNLKPYEEIKVQASTRDLDLRLSTAQLEKSTPISSGFNTAHKIKLAAPMIRRIMFRVESSEGPLPIGSSLSILGLDNEALVADQGMVYLEVPADWTTLKGVSDVKDCSFSMSLPELGNDIIENLPDIMCQ